MNYKVEVIERGLPFPVCRRRRKPLSVPAGRAHAAQLFSLPADLRRVGTHHIWYEGGQSDPNPRGAGEGHDVHIESSVLEVEPQAHVRWHRDIYGNSIAVLNFTKPAQNSASLASLSSLITLRIPSTLSLIQMGSSQNLF